MVTKIMTRMGRKGENKDSEEQEYVNYYSTFDEYSHKEVSIL